MVLLPTIKVLLPTHGLCHVYGNRRENVVTAMVLPPTIKVLNLPTAYAMYMEAGTHGLCHVYGNRRENVVTAMVLLPTIKVLLPTHGLCHVYGNRRENVVTAMVLLPKIKVMQLLIWCH